MKKFWIVFCLGLILVGLFIGCARKEKLAKADPAHIQNQLNKLAPVNIGADLSGMSGSARKTIDKLVEAAQVMDELFLRQVYSENLNIRETLRASKDPSNSLYLEYFTIMFGPFDRLDEDKPFIGTTPEPAGANYYPEDMTKEEFESWVADHPGDKEAFEGNFTLIRRKDDSLLVAIPYSEAYKELLEPASKLLEEAALITENVSLMRYLTSRATAFRTNDYFQSDIDWMDLEGLIEVVIGPYEVYEDNLFGYKAAFEAFVCVVDQAESEKLSELAQYLNDMEANLPIPAKHKNLDRGTESPIKVVNEVFTAGDTKAGVQTTAFVLPNDERVREIKGSKKVMLKNVMNAKFEKCWVPIVNTVMDSSQLPYVSFDAYFTHTLMHEISHSLGPGNITLKDGSQTTVNKALKELYSTIEEAKADILGVYNTQFMIDKGVFPQELEKQIYCSYLGGTFRSVRFGIQEAHGRGMMLQYNYLTEKGAYSYDDSTKRFRVNLDKVKDAVKELAHDLLMIEAEGNYDGASEMIEKYGVMTAVMQGALDRLSHVPVDIRPIYTIEQK
ncbi:peptidase [candidate division KSB1 bacterium]|nr:peptidase [candidate division KSB1 bacterium]